MSEGPADFLVVGDDWKVVEDSVFRFGVHERIAGKWVCRGYHGGLFEVVRALQNKMVARCLLEHPGSPSLLDMIRYIERSQDLIIAALDALQNEKATWAKSASSG